MEDRPRVAVLGGGISGLATAYFLSTQAGSDDRHTPEDAPVRPAVTLVEATGRLGGKIRTETLCGQRVDLGPDSLALRSPEISPLLNRLGLAEAVVTPSARGALVLSRGVLRRLPEGTMAGVPGKLLPVVRSRILSPAGLARASFDLVAPRQILPPDPSVGELLRPRFGAQVLERLVDALLGSVHAGRADLLSARSTVPEVTAVARDHRSLYLGLRHRLRRASGGFPLVGLDGGLATLVDALASQVPPESLRTGTAAAAVRRAPRRGYEVVLANGETITADAVVIATPAFVTANLVTRLAPPVAAALRDLAYADVATVTLGYRPDSVPHRLDGTGFLVPPAEGRLIVGCSWLSRKWPQLAASPMTLIRCAVGRYASDRLIPPTDDELVRQVHDELVDTLGVTAAPQQVRVERMPRALPQYLVGHADRLDRIDTALHRLPGLYLTGAAYRGIGIASCVADARRTAHAVLAQLTDAQLVAGAAQ